MSRLEIIRKIAFLDALEPPGAPLVGKDHEERERLIAELDHFDDERLDAQKRLRRLEGINRIRLGAKLMRRDLDVDDDSLQRLMGAAQMLWGAAMDDHYTRHKLDKASRPLTGEYDLTYGMAPWEIEATYFGRSNQGKWMTDIYRRGPGRPGNDPSQGPLYEVYLLVRAWWRRYHGKTKFRPTYGHGREDFNAAGRLFLDIATALDARYTTKDCASVYEKWRKRRQ